MVGRNLIRLSHTQSCSDVTHSFCSLYSVRNEHSRGHSWMRYNEIYGVDFNTLCLAVHCHKMETAGELSLQMKTSQQCI